jgi:hypothetical protein
MFRKLPDVKNATAVAKITYLALNATNPEVKEAFELMIKGGTPDPGDFTYTVPSYNTELQVLYWLAVQNEFRKDDTLALAVAIDHGIWVTMGDSEVASLARQDASSLLVFLRQTSQMQSQRGYFDLEKYALEAKMTLAWRGDQSSVRSYYDPRDYLSKRMDAKAYRWATIELSALTQMRELMDAKGWIQSDISRTVATLERYFFTGPNRMWIYPTADETITIDGQSVINHNFNSADLEFSYFVENGKGIGWCSDEMGLLNAFSKSWGIATSALWGDLIIGGKKESGHTHVIYYDPLNRVWKADPSQLDIDVQNKFNLFYISTPKVSLKGFSESNRGSGLNFVFSKFTLNQTDVNGVRSMFLFGVPSSEMKQWLLYG